MTSATSSKNSKALFIALLKALIGAINSELPNVLSFTLNGRTITRADLLAALQAFIDAATDTTTANNAWRAKVSAEKAARVEAAGLVSGMKIYVQGVYGKASPEVLKFGFKPATPPARTLVSKVIGVTKGAATRQLRNPLTPTEKKALKASVGATIEIPTNEPKPAAPPAVTPPAGSNGRTGSSGT
jgi:hypothetical protein